MTIFHFRNIPTIALSLVVATMWPDVAIAQYMDWKPLPQKTVTLYSGMVDAKNLTQFLRQITDSNELVVGIKATIDTAKSEQTKGHYSATCTNHNIELSEQSENGGIALIGEDIARVDSLGYCIIDGFFVVKYQGMANGVSWYKLQTLDSGGISTNSALNFVQKEL